MIAMANAADTKIHLGMGSISMGSPSFGHSSSSGWSFPLQCHFFMPSFYRRCGLARAFRIDPASLPSIPREPPNRGDARMGGEILAACGDRRLQCWIDAQLRALKDFRLRGVSDNAQLAIDLSKPFEKSVLCFLRRSMIT
jgi:hypothetical protein